MGRDRQLVFQHDLFYAQKAISPRIADGENVGPDWKAWMATYPWKDPKPPSYQAPDKPLGSGVSLDKQALQVIIKVAEM